jgi:hypothetical protein
VTAALGSRLSALALLSTLALGALPDAAQAQSATHLLVIAGAGGEPQYSAAFHDAAMAIADAARTRYGLSEASVVYLGEDPARAPAKMAGRSTRENVEAALVRLHGRAKAGDQLWVILIGHGSMQGEVPRFNLPGPDMTAADFKRVLAPFSAQQVAFVNASSASGDFVRALSGPNRAVVTATKSSLERNDTRFARHFAGALSTAAADVDKDGRVTLLEAYTYARRETVRSYESENKLLTEHAQLDDDGDGVAAAEPGGRSRDGALAATLALGGGAAASSDPRVAALATERRALEQRVAQLRQRKASMDSTTYERELETLLVSLARKSQELRAAEGAAKPAGAKP